MLNFSILSFILLSFWSQVQGTISGSANTCSQELPRDAKFESNQQIFNFHGSCCREKCMIPNGYKLSSEYGWYKIHSETKSWNEARKTCVSEGAHLGVFTSQEQIKFVQQALPQNNVQKVWVGYHDLFQEGDWNTVLDTSLGGDSGTVASWWPNEPDNYKGVQHCAVLDKNGMDDDVCTIKFAFICKFSSKDCD